MRLKTAPEEYLRNAIDLMSVVEKKTPKSIINFSESTQPISKGSKKFNLKDFHSKSNSFQCNNITLK